MRPRRSPSAASAYNCRLGGRPIGCSCRSRPGGDRNRIQLEVADVPAAVERLGRVGRRFRNDLVTGRGGRQILLDDPSELF